MVYNGVKLKKPQVSSTHIVCSEMLIPNMYTILRSDDFEDDT